MVRWRISAASAIALMLPAIPAAQRGVADGYRSREPEITPPARQRR